jgi:argininosuccinate synthase
LIFKLDLTFFNLFIKVRFELGYYALKPDVVVVAPWREWDLMSRQKLLEFADTHGIPIAMDKRGEAPFSVDANLLHTSSEGKVSCIGIFYFFI